MERQSDITAACSSAVSPLRICIASPDIVGPIRNGGVGTACTALAQALAKAGHDVTLLFTSDHFEVGDAQTWVDHYRANGITFAALEAEVTPPPHVNPMVYERDPVERSYRVYMWLRTHDFDVIHFPDYVGLGYFTALARRQGLCFHDTLICTTAHAPTYWARTGNESPLNDIAFVLRDRLERGLVASSDILISPSSYMIRWMQEQGWTLPKTRHVMPNLIPSDQDDSEHDAVVSPDSKPQRIQEVVFFGRLEARKGLLVFCDAVERIRASLPPDICITFMGKVRDGQAGKELLAARLRKWTVRWQLLDEFDTFQACAYLRGPGRLAVIPSLCDNSPYTVLECLTWRIAFIASDVGGVAELISPADRDRVLFRATPAALAERLEEALVSGIPIARQSFSHTENHAAHLQFHSELAAKLTAPEVDATPEAQPLVSVCLLHYERPVDLERALASLERQTYPHVEVVVVDNGSTSAATIELLDELQDSFSQRGWQMLRLRHNMYEPYARNHGARNARGKYLLFMDDDNVAKEHAAELFVRAADRTGAQVLTCFLDHFTTPEPPTHERDALKRFIPIGDAGSAGLLCNVYGDVNFFIERDAFLRVGGFVDDGRFNHAEDWRFLARAAGAGLRMTVVPEALAWYRVSNQSPRTSWRKRDRSGALMRAAEAFLPSLPRNVRDLVWLAQGLFWIAHESKAQVRALDKRQREAQNQIRRAEKALGIANARYADLLGEYRRLETAFTCVARGDVADEEVLARMLVSLELGKRRHFGLSSEEKAAHPSMVEGRQREIRRQVDVR